MGLAPRESDTEHRRTACLSRSQWQWKTTLIKLLVRLFKPTEGIITLNDIDIQKYDENEYRSLLGVVFQDFRLFAYSIAENVAATAHPDRERSGKP